jgi:hypothetical protein
MLPLTVSVLLLFARRRNLLAGVALGAAVWVKFVPVLLVPVLLRAAWDWSRLDEGPREAVQRRWSVGAFLAGTGTALLAGGIPLLLAGPEALQGLATYSRQWRTNGALFPMLEAVSGGSAPAIASLLAIGMALAVCITRIGSMHSLMQRIALVLMALLLVSPAVFPWYVTWLLPFAPFLVGAGERRVFGWAVLMWSGTALLWYLRFLAYSPVDAPQWPALATWLPAIRSFAPEPWRIVEYALVFCLLAAAGWQELVSRWCIPRRLPGTIGPRPEARTLTQEAK